MKKCINLETLLEVKDVLVSLDERYIDIPFRKRGFNLVKNQQFSHRNGFSEVEIHSAINYDLIYAGNLDLIEKGSLRHSMSKEEFYKQQTKYPSFDENFEDLYLNGEIEFREEYRVDWFRFTKSNKGDRIFKQINKLNTLQEEFNLLIYSKYIIIDEEKVVDFCNQIPNKKV